MEICNFETKANTARVLIKFRLLAIELVSIIDKNKETYCTQQNKIY